MIRKIKVQLEMPGIEPGAFHMRSERATTALHPLVYTANFHLKRFESFITNTEEYFEKVM